MRLGCRIEYLFRADAARTGAEAAAGQDEQVDAFIHLYLLNRGIVMTPFHNMALMSPAPTAADVDRHTRWSRRSPRTWLAEAPDPIVRPAVPPGRMVPPRACDHGLVPGRGKVTMQVEIVEVGPRDGLQNEDTLVDTPTKVALIERMLDSGVRRIEATSFVHPKRVPQMADAERVMAAVPRDRGASYIGLVLNDRGLDRALDAHVDEANVVVVVSETFSRRNQGVTVQEMLAAWERIAGRARDAGLRTSVTLSAAFGCPFEGEVDPARVADIAVRVADAGPDEIALADTIGVAVPPQVTDLMARVADRIGPVPLRCHFHNTRNTGFANVVAALDAGVAALDASVGGIGGCPFAPDATGNIATEDLIYLLDRMGVDHGVSLAATSRVAAWVGDQLGMTVPGLLSRAGPFPDAA